jgi:hypothetical protein
MVGNTWLIARALARGLRMRPPVRRLEAGRALVLKIDRQLNDALLRLGLNAQTGTL